MDILKGVKTLSDHNKKHHFKKKRYSIEANQLVRTITDPKTNKTETKRIAYLEQFFEIIYDIHCFKRFHQGIVKIYDQVLISSKGSCRICLLKELTRLIRFFYKIFIFKFK
jgi:hypothetical protein